MHNVVVIGAGVIGMSIGWQLAKEKMHVHILEQRCAGRQASWAAAGMLAPYCEAQCENLKLLQLGEQSLSLYSRYLDELAEDCALEFPVECEGTLCVAVDSDDRKHLQREFQNKKKLGIPLFWLSGEEVRDIEPLLSPRVTAGIWIPSEKHINNRILLDAVRKAFLFRGGQLTENTKAIKVLRKANHVWGVQTENGQTIEADIVINAAGAWADQFRLPNCSSEAYIRPIKGQIATLKMPKDLALKNMIRTPRVYLVPKQEGTVRIGATDEDAGFDEEVTAGAVLKMLQDAWEAVPAIYEYKMVEAIAGLRPAASNQLPQVGPTSLLGYYQAIGHGRSGILLAPLTAYSLKQTILEDYFHVRSI